MNGGVGDGNGGERESARARAGEGFAQLGFAVLGLLAMVLVVGMVARALGVGPGADGEVQADRVQDALLAQGAGSLAVVVLWCFVPAAPFVGRWRWTALAPPTYVAFLALIWLPATLLYASLLHQLGSELPQQQHMQWFVRLRPETPGAVGALLVVVLVGPIAEEMLFRGWLQRGLRLLLGPNVGLVAASALFGAMHGPLLTVPIGLLGFLFGWLRERSGGLAAPIVAHMLHNSIMVAVAMQKPEVLEMLGR